MAPIVRMDAIISRADAISLGLDRYFTGQPCKYGHVSSRRVKTAHCLECEVRQWRSAYERRRQGKQLPMMEYRAQVRGAFEDRQRRRDKEAQTRKAEQVAQREISAALRKERSRAQSKAWREANRERYRELIRSWKKRNRDKINARKIKRRKSLIDELFPKQRGRCAYCREPVKKDEIHIDHIQPKAKGGSNARRNLQICCPDCNIRKRDRNPVEFAQSVGLLV